MIRATDIFQPEDIKLIKKICKIFAGEVVRIVETATRKVVWKK